MKQTILQILHNQVNGVYAFQLPAQVIALV